MTKGKGMLTIVKLKKEGGFAKTQEVQRERMSFEIVTIWPSLFSATKWLVKYNL